LNTLIAKFFPWPFVQGSQWSFSGSLQSVCFSLPKPSLTFNLKGVA
jgi:hypothetical protein